jgi:putative FmdB family regulatory protein
MPIHEYQCEKCGYIFEEVTLKMSAVKLSTSCPACKEKDDFGIAKKVLSSGSFRINGYNSSNDYAGHMR